MARARKSKPRRGAKALYFSAKISDYQFRKVLWHFTRDDTAVETARHVALSVNSINAIFHKLREFFFDVGLFEDIYQGRDPREGTGDPEDMIFEDKLIKFHMKRGAAKRGLDGPHARDLHFAESHWRFWYAVMVEDRPSTAIHRMMFAHLLEIIRCCGPVGQPPTRRKDGLLLVLRQFEQRVRWMGRNAKDLNDAEIRMELNAISK